MERRRTIRLMTGKGLVSLGRRSGELVGAGWPLRDISEGGLRFALSGDHPELPSPGEGVVVTVELGSVASGSATEATRRGRAASGSATETTGSGEEAKPFRLSGVVRRVKKTKKGGRGACEVSLEFTGLSQENRALLRGTVIDLAMEKIEKGTQELAPAPRKKRDEGAGDRLGDILVARSSLSRDEMERFVREDFEKDRPLGRQLVSRGVVDERGVAKALAEQSGLGYADLDAEGVDLLKVRQFSQDYLTRHLFVPLEVGQFRVKVAAASPLADEAVREIERQYNRPVKIVIASERQVVSAIQKAFHVARNRRRSARLPAGLGVRFKVYGEDWKPLHDAVLVGLTKNISGGGMLFVGPEPERTGLADAAGRKLHVGLHLILPEEPQPVRAACELVRTTLVREAGQDGVRRVLLLYGVRVLGVSDEDREKLNRFRLSVCMRRPAPGGRDARPGR